MFDSDVSETRVFVHNKGYECFLPSLLLQDKILYGEMATPAQNLMDTGVSADRHVSGE